MEDNSCGICCDVIEDSENTILQCGHNYHYNCIMMAYKFSKESKCSYCKKKKKICSAILKTGKNKGKQCSCSVIGSLNFCGRHIKNVLN